jgi:hypothetical protein
LSWWQLWREQWQGGAAGSPTPLLLPLLSMWTIEEVLLYVNVIESEPLLS